MILRRKPSCAKSLNRMIVRRNHSFLAGRRQMPRLGNSILCPKRLLGVLLTASGVLAQVACSTLQHHGETVYAKFYVDPSMGSDKNSGTEDQPFASIDRAREAAKELSKEMNGDLLLYLRGGTYQLDRPLVLRPEDSGQNGHRITYTAYPGETPILTGGRAITGWMPAENGLYKARAGGLHFRQLYINGKPRVRARNPNAGSMNRLAFWDESNRTIAVKITEMPILPSLEGVEMVILKEWTQNNLRLATYAANGEEAILTPLEPDRTKAFSGHLSLRKRSQSYYLENSLAFLDEGGEWYLHTSSDEVFYKPESGEDMTTISAIAPRLPQLLRIEGSVHAPVHDIQFSGIVFEHSTWLEPNEEGFATGQADNIFKGQERDHQIPGAIHVEYAHHIRFDSNVFRNLGSTAITLRVGVRDTVLTGNQIYNISASGISVGMDLQKLPADSLQVCRSNVISNNVISAIGRDYHSSVGIFAGYTEGLVIENNELSDMPYTGISIGWGWTTEETVLRKNIIKRNRIHGVMNLLADGGAIYTLSKQPGTAIVENYIYDIKRSPWAGEFPISAIYLDEGSSGMYLANNLLENVPLGLDLHHAEHNTVVNNTAVYQGRAGSSYNAFLRDGVLDPDRIRMNAGATDPLQ
ncbi:MAG TPA: right-handed parallel beta-helix repeat-containing protein [Nitrospira sp.]|nr:right-handed parallel beta-helix repeat-containing protein [Nitrospira sp.]